MIETFHFIRIKIIHTFQEGAELKPVVVGKRKFVLERFENKVKLFETSKLKHPILVKEDKMPRYTVSPSNTHLVIFFNEHIIVIELATIMKQFELVTSTSGLEFWIWENNTKLFFRRDLFDEQLNDVQLDHMLHLDNLPNSLSSCSFKEFNNHLSYGIADEQFVIWKESYIWKYVNCFDSSKVQKIEVPYKNFRIKQVFCVAPGLLLLWGGTSYLWCRRQKKSTDVAEAEERYLVDENLFILSCEEKIFQAELIAASNKLAVTSKGFVIGISLYFDPLLSVIVF